MFDKAKWETSLCLNLTKSKNLKMQLLAIYNDVIYNLKFNFDSC